MSAKVWTFLVAVTIAMVLVVFPALAQSPPLRANIPFPFVVSEVEFTPGIYTARLTSSRQVLEIRSEDGKKAAFVLLLAAQANKAQHQGLFVFNGYGNQYFLSKVSWPDYGTGCELLKSEREKDIARRVESQSVSIAPINR